MKLKIPEVLTRGVFNWDRVKLSENYTTSELAKAIQQIQDDPASANPKHKTREDINLYTPAAKKRTEALAWAITHILSEKKRKLIA